MASERKMFIKGDALESTLTSSAQTLSFLTGLPVTCAHITHP